MEDVHQFLPNANQHAINNVQLYLWVTTLYKITDSSGTFILEQYLMEPTTHLTSTLHWLDQSTPTSEAWRIWCQVITTLYSKTNSVRLMQPLGNWYAEILNSNWTWTWHINPSTLALYSKSHDGWMEMHPICKWCTYTNTTLVQQGMDATHLTHSHQLHPTELT